MSTPYRKVYGCGVLSNPITKENPYLVEPRPDKRKIRK